ACSLTRDRLTAARSRLGRHLDRRHERGEGLLDLSALDAQAGALSRGRPGVRHRPLVARHGPVPYGSQGDHARNCSKLVDFWQDGAPAPSPVPFPRRPGWWNGRHGALKMRCPHGRVGSTPTPGTTTLACPRRGHGGGSLAWVLAAASEQECGNSYSLI